MNKLSRVIAMSVFGLSGSAFAADGDSGRNRMLADLDTDGDGSVNFEEFQARGAESLGRLDSDENGVLTLDELLNARPGRRPADRGDREGQQREPTEEQIARMEERRAEMMERATARFHAMDTDGDEMISITEYQEANFLQLDRDNNGLLSSRELRRHRGARRGPGGPRGQRPQRQ